MLWNAYATMKHRPRAEPAGCRKQVILTPPTPDHQNRFAQGQRTGQDGQIRASANNRPVTQRPSAVAAGMKMLYRSPGGMLE